MTDHWLRGAHLEHRVEPLSFDPVVEGTRLGLKSQVSEAIWVRVRRDLTDGRGQCDERKARRRFREVAAHIAARNGGLLPDPGRVTRYEAEFDARDGDAERDLLAEPIPGKTTLVLVEQRPSERPAPPRTVETSIGGGGGRVDPVAPRRPTLDDLFSRRGSGSPDATSTAPSRIRHDQAARAAMRGELLTITHALALDTGSIEIVIDDRSRSRLASAGVRGMQEGQAVYLHPDAYRPGTEDGRYLLAHELVHLAQRKLPVHPQHSYRSAEAEATALGRMYARGHGMGRPTVGLAATRTANDEPGSPEDKLLADPAPVTRVVQMLHVYYEPRAGGATWTGGVDKKLQAMAMILKDLVGDAYSVALLHELVTSQGGLQAIDTSGSLHGLAVQNERITRFGVSGALMLGFSAWLAAPPRNLKGLTADQVAVLQAGVDVEDTWPDVRPELPAWATLALYAGFMGVTQADLLKQYGQAKRLMGSKPADVHAGAYAAIHTQVVAAIVPAFLAMDSIRTDRRLSNEAAYRVLWDLPVIAAGKHTEVALANAGNPAPVRPALFFLLDAHGYPALARSAPADPEARKQLFDRFKVRIGSQGLPTDGDFVLHDGPVHAVRPPLASSMTSYPALEAPFFDAARGQEREFVMNIEMPDVFEAFRGYVYTWELLRVAQNDVDQLPSSAGGLGHRGDSPGPLGVLGHRLARDGRDGSADIRRSIGTLESQLGQPGLSVGLVASNAMLRMVGTVIKTFVETLFKPRHETTMPFPADGLYVVRCIALPRPIDGAMTDRGASVSWLPVWVRPARDISVLRAHVDQQIVDATLERLHEITGELADTSLSDEARTALEQEKQRIERSVHTSGSDLLEQERQGLLAAAPTAEGHQKEAIEKRLAEIEQILAMRTARLADAKTDGSLEAAVRIPAVFVGDNGQLLRPLFEVFQRRSTGAALCYHAVDSTAKNSGHRTGTGRTREDAIAGAIQSILESDQGYGRGCVTLTIPAASMAATGAKPIERTIRIEKSTGALMAEAVENLASIASIAALAAAPFTAGASLALLVPIGVVGALPSAYRLLDRGEQGVLRFDMATAMDLVNILGAAVGAGQEFAAGRAALRGMPLGKGWIALGLGTDGLGMLVVGAGVIDQIADLARDPNLPPGLRNAMIAQLVGSQLIQLGVAAGAQLYMYGKTQQAHHGRNKAVGDHPLIEPHLQDRFREAIGPKGEAIAVYRDVEGRQVRGTGIEIHYELDAYGLPTDLHVVAGAAAGESEILLHAHAAKRMLEYQGFVGLLRNLRDRMIVLFRYGKLPPKPGSRAWEARIEIEIKLPEAIRQVYTQLGTGQITSEIADSRIKDLREQMLVHEQALDEVAQGKGHVAINDGVTAKAVAAGYPAPPPGHYYYETFDGEFQLQRTFDSDASPAHIKWKKGTPYLAPGPIPTTGRTVDVDALRSHAAAWLSVTPERVVACADVFIENVSVRPPTTPGGAYEIHYKPGMSEVTIKIAIDEHLELAARRPNPNRPRDSHPPPWTFDDETAYRGNEFGRKVPEVAVGPDEPSHKETAQALIRARRLDDALDYICNAYGFNAPNMRVVVVDHIQKAWAVTNGSDGEGNRATITFTRKLFYEDYTFVVRTIGHEYQHVLQRRGAVPIRGSDLREFLAWAWEALDPIGPQYDEPTAAVHAIQALSHYQRLSPQEKLTYADLKNQLEHVGKKL